MTTMAWVMLGFGGWLLLSVLFALVVGWAVCLRDQQRPPCHEDEKVRGPL